MPAAFKILFASLFSICAFSGSFIEWFSGVKQQDRSGPPPECESEILIDQGLTRCNIDPTVASKLGSSDDRKGCAQLCIDNQACKFSVYNHNNTHCKSYETCDSFKNPEKGYRYSVLDVSMCEKAAPSEDVVTKEDETETVTENVPTADKSPEETEQNECEGELLITEGAERCNIDPNVAAKLGSAEDPKSCAKSCIDDASCTFAVYNHNNAHCKSYESCDSFKNPEKGYTYSVSDVSMCKKSSPKEDSALQAKERNMEEQNNCEDDIYGAYKVIFSLGYTGPWNMSCSPQVLRPAGPSLVCNEFGLAGYCRTFCDTTCAPSVAPSAETTLNPSPAPTSSPTFSPTLSPTTSEPTVSPTSKPTASPTSEPTASPTTSAPVTATPTATSKTTPNPTRALTQDPTKRPTSTAPTEIPTTKPSPNPTTKDPTRVPSFPPSTAPTIASTTTPTTIRPSESPSTAFPTFDVNQISEVDKVAFSGSENITESVGDWVGLVDPAPETTTAAPVTTTVAPEMTTAPPATITGAPETTEAPETMDITAAPETMEITAAPEIVKITAAPETEFPEENSEITRSSKSTNSDKSITADMIAYDLSDAQVNKLMELTKKQIGVIYDNSQEKSDEDEQMSETPDEEDFYGNNSMISVERSVEEVMDITDMTSTHYDN